MRDYMDRIVIVTDKTTREYVAGTLRGTFFYRDPFGCFHKTAVDYVEIRNLRDFFRLWDVMPGFSITIPPDSPWFDENMEQVAGMTHDGSHFIMRETDDC